MQVEDSLEVSPGGTNFTARCFVCRNRYGLINLMALATGILCCRRCWQSRRFLLEPRASGTEMVAG